ncbi:MAG: Ig-like domain-containing protein [Candidatus Cloacimonadota bacterium]
MYTLSTPFMWNGTDNLVVDTAFGLIGSYASTGQVQYTSVTNGYRYIRSDTVDQTEVFTGGSSTAIRPNLKVVVIPQDPPTISIDPISLNYDEVEVGETVVQQFSISNTGDQTLTGSITTPAGYVVTNVSRENPEAPAQLNRNSLSFSIDSEESQSFNLSFAPISAISYNGNVVISSNDPENPSLNLAVTGSGYSVPSISASVSSLSSLLESGEEGSQSFNLMNSGSQALNYTISVVGERSARANHSSSLQAKNDDRSIAGSTLVVNAETYLPGTTQDWSFTVTNASTDTEWLEDVIISFPAGVTVNSATNFVGGSGGAMVASISSGSSITITWHGENSSGWGVVEGGEFAIATVNVSIAPSFSGDLNLPYTINGDVYNAEPHTLSDTIVLAQGIPPVEWLSIEPLSGTIPGGESRQITALFSALGMSPDTYEAEIIISSNDPTQPSLGLPATLVVEAANLAPQIDLPEGFSFDKNGSLTQSFSAFVSDEDNDPLTLSVSGNSNVLVQINGLSVTFSTIQNWVGTETFTFTVSDGHLTASDNLSITVNPVYSPAWNPVLYPNNPATLYAQVQIEGVTAGLNDVVAAFVGTECRGRADVVMHEGQAYCTLLVNLASQGETVRFRIYSHSQDLIHPVPELMSMRFGTVYGQPQPVLLNGTNTITLGRPELSISRAGATYNLTWTSVPNANLYKIYRSDSPDGPFTQIVSTSLLYYSFTSSNPRGFFKVVAEQYYPFKGAEE